MCLLLSFSLQHYFWQCILSPSRWLQLGWHHLLLLFHLLALAGAVGKTNLQGLSAPSSITICQTCKKKKRAQGRGSAGDTGCNPWSLLDSKLCFTLALLMGSEAGKELRCAHFTCHPHSVMRTFLIGKYRSPAAKSN